MDDGEYSLASRNSSAASPTLQLGGYKAEVTSAPIRASSTNSKSSGLNDLSLILTGIGARSGFVVKDGSPSRTRS